MFCDACSASYSIIPDSWRKNCDQCNVPLMVQCHTCEQRFVLSSHAYNHIKGHCLRELKCGKCNFMATCGDSLQEHMSRVHPGQADFESCNKNCGRSFPTRQARAKHEKHCGMEANLKCKYCSFKTKYVSVIKMHQQQHLVGNHKLKKMRIKSPKDLLPIPLTPNPLNVKVFISLEGIGTKLESHCMHCDERSEAMENVNRCGTCQRTYMFRCKICGQEFCTYFQTRVHAIRCHTEPIHQCNTCLRKYAYEVDYKKHLKVCCLSEIKQCNKCSFTTKYKKSLLAHTSRMHPTGNEPVYICHRCNKQFTFKHTLNRHLNSFCGVEPRFNCDHCTFRTKSKFSLLRHIQSIHAQMFREFHFQCDYCAKNFTNNFIFDQHFKQCKETFLATRKVSIV